MPSSIGIATSQSTRIPSLAGDAMDRPPEAFDLVAAGPKAIRRIVRESLRSASPAAIHSGYRGLFDALVSHVST
jgi:hypothetical protein